MKKLPLQDGSKCKTGQPLNPMFTVLCVHLQKTVLYNTTIAFRLISHQPPVPHPSCDPSTQSYASLHSWRVAGLTVCLSCDMQCWKLESTCFLLDDPVPILFLLLISRCYSDLSPQTVYIYMYTLSYRVYIYIIYFTLAKVYNAVSTNRVTVKLLYYPDAWRYFGAQN